MEVCRCGSVEIDQKYRLGWGWVDECQDCGHFQPVETEESRTRDEEIVRGITRELFARTGTEDV